jgi:hypothetical protein
MKAEITKAPASQSLLKSDSILGMALRLVLFLLLLVVAFVTAFLVNQIWLHLVPSNIVLVMWLITVAPMLVGVVCSEFPRGNDMAFFRLGIATFCRTGLPLLIVLIVDRVGGAHFGREAYGFLGFFYLIGFVASVWISISQIDDTTSAF